MIARSLLSLADAGFYRRELLESDLFFALLYEGRHCGVMGFYRKRGARYFAYSIFEEFRGIGLGRKFFEIFVSNYSGFNFCVKSRRDEFYAGAVKIYNSFFFRAFSFGDEIIFINGSLWFRLYILAIEFSKLAKRHLGVSFV